MQLQCLYCAGGRYNKEPSGDKRIFTAFTTTRTTRNTSWRQRTRGIMSDGGMVQGPPRGGQVNRGNTAGEAQKNITACLKTV